MTRARILLVEDNPINIRLVRKILEHRGHEVIEATTVNDARARLFEFVPDIILLDIQIPGGGGPLVCSEVRSSSRLRHIPIVAVTAQAMQGDRERLLGSGFDGYISKPIDTRTFGPEIETFLGKNSEAAEKQLPPGVLVLDDDPLFRDLVVPVLQQKAYRVFQAENGRDAMSVVRDEKLDLIIVDYMLPDTNGCDWIAALRATGNQVKVMLVSAYSRDLGVLRAMIQQLKIDLTVQKPIIPAVFAELVQYQLQDKSTALASSSESLEAHLTALRIAYASELPGRIKQLTETLRRAQKEREYGDWHKDARNLAHNLSGTAGSHGFEAVGRILFAVEVALQNAESKKIALPASDWEEVSTRLAEAEELVLSSNDNASAESQKVGRVLVVDDSPDIMRAVVAFGRKQLWEVVPATGYEDALSKAKVATPDVAVLDLWYEEKKNGFDLARELRSLPGCESLPFAFMSGDGRLENRIMAAHLGASVYLSKPLDMNALGGTVRQLFDLRQAEKPNVLVVDDDANFTALLSVVLRRAGILMSTISDSTTILDALEEHRPELVLVDVEMPGINGFDVCRIIRTTPVWRDMPIVFLTARTESESRIAAYQAGGDDYLAKPIVNDELLAKIRMLIERSRLLKERADKDALTGLMLRRAFLERLHSRIAEAARRERKLVVGLIDLDHFKKVNDTYGHLTGDRVLASMGGLLTRRFRSYDLRGRWGGEEFIVAFPDEDAATIQVVLTRVLEEFRAMSFQDERGGTFRATFSSGIAEFPSRGTTAEALISAADECLYAAKESGRNQVLGGPSAQESTN